MSRENEQNKKLILKLKKLIVNVKLEYPNKDVIL
jgi:hypothetical protein